VKFLFAWELGANLGHILRQRLIARELRSRGHTIIFFLKDMEIAHTVLGEDRFEYGTIPHLLIDQRPAGRKISSYGDILLSKGFGRIDVMEPTIAAWIDIFLAEEPDVVLLDHSPAALFAARMAGIPTFNIGTGFEIPPKWDRTYPIFRHKANKEALKLGEDQIVGILNTIALMYGRSMFSNLPSCMRADEEALLTFPEFDHYPDRQDGKYFGPLFDVEHGLDVKWPAGGQKNVFVYVQYNESVCNLLDALTAIDLNVICYIPGLPDDIKEQYASPNMVLHTTPVRLDALLPTCNLVVSHAAHGLVSACVYYGVPVLGNPTQMEQYMQAMRLVAVGNGTLIPDFTMRRNLQHTLHAVLFVPDYTACALKLGIKYVDHNQQNVVREIADIAERLGR
jgi:hypothetical protein